MNTTFVLTQVVYSCGKTVAAIVVGMLVDKKLLSYNAKVKEYWPEFGSLGKEDLTLADVLRHEGGMPVFSTQMKVEDCYTENLSNNVLGNIIEKQGLKYPEGEFK